MHSTVTQRGSGAWKPYTAALETSQSFATPASHRAAGGGHEALQVQAILRRRLRRRASLCELWSKGAQRPSRYRGTAPEPGEEARLLSEIASLNALLEELQQRTARIPGEEKADWVQG
eukprot:s1376_g11.t1